MTFTNIGRRGSAALRLFGRWLVNPLNYRLLLDAGSTLGPVMTQLQRSWYICVFCLPRSLATGVGAIGNFTFYRMACTKSNEKQPLFPELYSKETTDKLAVSLGPSLDDCVEQTSPPKGGGPWGYSKDVRIRAPSGGWTSRLGLYRDDLSVLKWTQSPEVRASLDALAATARTEVVLKDSQSSVPVLEGALRAPTTVIWGEGDVALDETLSLETMDAYLVANKSQIVSFPDAGHWVQVRKCSRDIIIDLLLWGLENKTKLKDCQPLAKYEGIKVSFERQAPAAAAA